MTIRNTLAGGRRSGIATAAGVSLGQAIWTLAAIAGVVAVLSASEPAFRALKLAGAAYLIYLGAQSIRAALRNSGHAPTRAHSDADMHTHTESPLQQTVAKSPRPAWWRHQRPHERLQQSVASPDRLVPRKALRQGVLSNLGNPKMAVFFASLLPQFAGADSGSFLVLLALGLLFCSMTLAWLTLYAVAVARLRHLLAGPVRRVVDAVTGVALVLFGARLTFAER